MKLRLLAEAQAEIDDAFAYLERQQPGLGHDFIAEVSHGYDQIQDFPHAWQMLRGRVRRYLLRRFSYALIYAELPEEIVVVAVPHLRRRPGYWRKRLKRLRP
jgi:plasmid stabilization system protein ParE